MLLRLFLELDDELGGDTLYLPLSRYVSRLGANVEQEPADGLAAFAQLSQMTGWLALDGNRHGSARRYLTTAPHRIRDRVHYLVRLARCYLLQREVERACEIATEALALSEAIGSARVIERIGEFHVALEPFAASKAAREFRELYASVITQRLSVN